MLVLVVLQIKDGIVSNCMVPINQPHIDLKSSILYQEVPRVSGVQFLVKADSAYPLCRIQSLHSLPREPQVFYSPKQITPLRVFEVSLPGVSGTMAPRVLHEAAQGGLGISLISFQNVSQSVSALPVDCRAFI